MADQPTRAAIYVRISQDTGGEGLGVKRQETACRELADRLGWNVVNVYSDNDVSAYKRKQKRPAYEQLLADVQSGRVNAIIAWAADRLHRQLRELVRFIDIVKEHSVEIQVVVGGHLDLSSPVGKMTAQTLGSIAEYESDIKVARINQKIQELVKAGKVHNGGARPFGYERIFAGEGDRRKIIRDELCEEEAELIREARDRVFAGASLYSIIKDWNERGLKTSTKRGWTTQALKLMLQSGRIAGIKEHHRKPVGDAAWPAIISKDDHHRLKAILAERARPRRKGAGPVGRRHWLTGYIFCQRCQKPLKISGRSDNKKLIYECAARALGTGSCGRLSIDYTAIEEMMTTIVLNRLSNPAILRELAAREDTSKEEADALVAGIEADERRLAALEDQLADVEPEELFAHRTAIRKVRSRINEDRDQLASLAGAEPLVGLNVDDIEDRWGKLDPKRKGALLRVVGIERVVVHPARFRGRFDPDRVEVVPVSR